MALLLLGGLAVVGRGPLMSSGSGAPDEATMAEPAPGVRTEPEVGSTVPFGKPLPSDINLELEIAVATSSAPERRYVYCDVSSIFIEGLIAVGEQGVRIGANSLVSENRVLVPVEGSSGSTVLQQDGVLALMKWSEASLGGAVKCDSMELLPRSVIYGIVTEMDGSRCCPGDRVVTEVLGCGATGTGVVNGEFLIFVEPGPCVLWVRRSHGTAQTNGPGVDVDPRVGYDLEAHLVAPMTPLFRSIGLGAQSE